MSDNDSHNLTEQKYKELFANGTVERCSYELLKRNIKTAE